MVNAFPTKFSQPTGTVTNHYKNWSYLDNLKTGKTCRCGEGSIRNDYSLHIGGKNGTWPIPAPLTMQGFNLDLTGTSVSKVIVHYRHCSVTMSSSTAYPSIGAPTITLCGKSATGKAVPHGPSKQASVDYNVGSEFEYTVEFTGITANQLMSNPSLVFAYPKNANTNPGDVLLGNVYLEVVVSNIKMNVNIEASESSVIIGKSFDVDVSVTNTSTTSFDSQLVIDHSKCSFSKMVSGDGTFKVKDSDSTYWNVSFKGKETIKATFRLTANTEGTSTIKVTAGESSAKDSVKISSADKLTVTNLIDDAILVETKKNYILTNTQFYYKVKFKSDTLREYDVKLNFPSGTDIVNLNSLHEKYGAAMYTRDNLVYLELNPYNDKKTTDTVTITIKAVITHYGTFTQKVTSLSGNTEYSSDKYVVYSDSPGDLFFTRIKIDQDVLDSMGDGVTYRIGSMMKYTNTTSFDLPPYKHECRLGVWNADKYDNDDEVNALSRGNENEFLRKVVWSSQCTDEWSEVTVDFTFNSDYPLYIVWSGVHSHDTFFKKVFVDFSAPVMIEKSFYNKVKEDKVYPRPVKLLLENEDYAECTIPALEDTAPILLYSWDDGGLFDMDNVAIHGIRVYIDHKNASDIECQAYMTMDDYESSNRSINLSSSGSTGTLGSKYDLFGLSVGNYLEKYTSNNVEHMLINKMRLWLVFVNNNSKDVTFNTNNVRIVVTFLYFQDTKGFNVNGERTEWYGLYVTDVDYKFGTDNDKEEYHVSGTDNTIINRANIDPKELKIDFSLPDCSMADEMYLLERVVDLFSNYRNLITNKPATKWLIWDYMPKRRFYWVRIKPFDNKFRENMLTGTVTLEIPSGTTRSTDKTITGATGKVDGYISVEPVLRVKTKVKGEIDVKETVNNQRLGIEDSRIQVGGTVVIDNSNRKVTYTKGNTSINLTKKIDFNTTWFKLRGEYDFESPNGNVYSVEYYTRW